ncbi:uncharacterized protein SCHCODRAFT_02541962 [Schizophyllum commune H4-8]|uniref:uncharacterized protein n=1 Tax=Schizophyllum commune (strain H4-8 / FGSC 9210) TaxID=578458 RepID=UPI002160FA25|nr:uncharacterized protein SCHCODRAFT_02541962 [Schizophyllum commune H4-8]KAI5892306.1 hypothetical protein SCHCODRAFT_02541962 [Schizophyllum commune H4-8]
MDSIVPCFGTRSKRNDCRGLLCTRESLAQIARAQTVSSTKNIMTTPTFSATGATVTIASPTTTVTVNAGSTTTTITVAPATNDGATRIQRPVSPPSASGAGWYKRLRRLRRLIPNRRSLDHLKSQNVAGNNLSAALPAVANYAPEPQPTPKLRPAPAPLPQPALQHPPVPERTSFPKSTPAPPPSDTSSNKTAGYPTLSVPTSISGKSPDLSTHVYSTAQVQPSIIASPLPPDALMVELWDEAIAHYEGQTGHSLSDTGSLNSKEAITAYIDEHAPQTGVKDAAVNLLPIARIVGSLCDPIGNLVSTAFPGAGVVFSAIGILVKATISVHDELEAACLAFKTIDLDLRIIKPIPAAEMDDTLRKVSVEILAQVLAVLALITKLRKEAKIKMWLRKLYDPDSEVSGAMENLRGLTNMHHHSMAALTHGTTSKLLVMLKDAIADAAQERDHIRMYLECITKVAQEIYGMVGDNRGLLESIQDALLQHMTVVTRSIDRFASGDVDVVIKWLNYPNSSSKLNALLGNRHPTTGSWFLDGPKFAALKAGSCKSLLVHGKAFCGKSTLMAAANRDLRASCLCTGVDAVVLVHLFDVVNVMQQERNLASLLSSLLCQLALANQDALKELLRFRSAHAKGYSQAPVDSMRSYFRTILGKIMPKTRVYIVVDGVDQAASDVISFIEELCAIPNVSLLISLRSQTPIHRTLEHLFPSPAQIIMSSSQVSRDIETLLNSKFAAGGALASASGDDEQQIRKEVLSKADGNFLWTVLFLRDLESVVDVPSLLSGRIKAVPETVDQLYTERLESFPSVDRENVRRLLMWVVLSYSDFSTEEFARLLCFDYSGARPEYRFKPNSPETAVTLVGSTLMMIPSTSNLTSPTT